MNFLEILKEQLEKEEDKREGFQTNIENDTVENENFRKVLFTGPKIQLVVMSLGPGEDIGLENHPDTDQFIRVDKGEGEALIGGKKYSLKDGDAIIIPSGSEHNVTASDKGIKLYTVYSPPHHPDKAVHKTKEEAEEAESKE